MSLYIFFKRTRTFKCGKGKSYLTVADANFMEKVKKCLLFKIRLIKD